MSVSADPRIGSELLGYRVEALIGRGGMSIVYRAEDVRLKRKVALKLLAPDLAEDERFRERFLGESELAASLDHPHIVPIYDAGEHEGQLYIAMRYVEGSDLKHVLKSEGALEPTRALGLVEELADALDAAHARGLVHRDVKPSNALLDNSGHLYLSDFGLTKSASDRSALTLTGRIIGTVDYAAPEQIEGKGVDGRADVYSLGCLLYECLSGQVPFPRDSELAVLWAHVHEPPPKLAAYPAIDPVIAKVLAKHPKARYASCAEFVEAARKALGPREVVILRDRKPLLMAALGMLLAAGALTAGLVLALGGGGSRPKADLTVRENTLVRIDPKANRIVAVTPVGRRPRAVAVGGSLVWVYNADDNTVTSIDAGTNAVEETDAVPGFPPSDPFSHPLAADNTGAWLVTSVGGEGFLTHIRPGRPFQPQYRLPYEPVSVAIGQGSIWVAARTANSSVVLRLNPRTGALLATIPLPGRIDGQDAQQMTVGLAAVWVTTTPPPPYGVLYRIDERTSRVTGRVRFRCDLGCAGVTVGDGTVWVSTNPRLIRLDPRTLRAAGVVQAQSASYGADVAAGEGAVWWNGGFAGTVRRVDPNTDRTLSTIRITPPRPASSVFVAFHPYAIAAGAGAVWVTSSSSFGGA